MDERVALMGYGRFGRAFSGLLAAAGVPYRVYEPRADAEVPSELRVGSLAALCEGASLVVLAVPVPAMRATLEQLRPHLTPAQIVLDVGSVKVRPVEALTSVLGRNVPWVGTHPLFGPHSLARGERPLRVVVCPNALHPEAVRRARALFERLGCEVMEMSAEAHDQGMARTHALTMFLARGLLEAGVGEPVAFAPPSFQPLARLVEYARSEAPHLFPAVQAENPYASEARVRLMDALTRLHAELEAYGAPPREGGGG